MSNPLLDESGNVLLNEGVEVVTPSAGSFSLTGFDVAAGDLSLALGAGSFASVGNDLNIPEVATGAILDEGFDPLLDESGQPLNDESTIGTAVPLNLGAFTLTGYTGSIAVTGSVDVSLNVGAFNLGGPLLGIGWGLGDLDGNLNTAPDPDEIDYIPENPFEGTIYWVVTASATPPALQGTPAGFASSGLANGSFAVTTGGGSDTIDLSSVSGGNYYIHVVGQRTSDGAFTTVDSDAITIDGDLEAGSFAIVGYSVSTSRLVRTDLGVFNLTGHPFSVNNSSVNLDAGTLTITGFSLGVTPNVPLNAGSFSYSGLPLTAGRLSRLPTGAFNITGRDLIAEGTTQSALDRGSFALIGRDLVIAANDNVALNSRSFTITGRDLTAIEGFPTELDTGTFVISGFGVTATILNVADPNIATPENSLRGGIISVPRRSGILGDSERKGVLPQSKRGGIVKRGS